METILKYLKGGLSTLHVSYAYGFAIILFTVLVKAATFPLSKKQVESAMAMRSLQPQVKAIQERYAGDQERIQLETVRLYKSAGINPLAGCLPTLATIPVWIGLYRALSNVADEGLLGEGFFWIPSLAGPTTVAARKKVAVGYLGSSLFKAEFVGYVVYLDTACMFNFAGRTTSTWMVRHIGISCVARAAGHLSVHICSNYAVFTEK